MPELLTYPMRAFLDLSTGHLTIATREWMDTRARETALTPEDCGRWIAPTPYGWFCYADEQPTKDFPADLVSCMQEARRRGAEYILFDRDATPPDAACHLAWYGDDDGPDAAERVAKSFRYEVHHDRGG